MGIGDAHDRSIIPLHDLVQQAHQTRVRDKRANFRFVDRGIVSHYASSARFFCQLTPTQHAKDTKGLVFLSTEFFRVYWCVSWAALLLRFVPKRIEVKPVVRRKTRVMLEALGVALCPELNVFGAMIAIQSRSRRQNVRSKFRSCSRRGTDQKTKLQGNAWWRPAAQGRQGT